MFRSKKNAELLVEDSVGSNSDFKFDYVPTIEYSDEKDSRLPPNECAGLSTSFSASEVPAASKRARGRPRKHSNGDPSASSAASPAIGIGTHESHDCVRFSKRSSMSPRCGQSSRQVPQTSQTALAAKRTSIKRLSALQNSISAQNTSFRETRTLETEDVEPVDQMVLPMGLTNVATPSSKSSSFEVSISMDNAPSVSLFDSLVVDQLSSQQVL